MTGAERLERNRPGCIRRVSDVMVSRFALIASEDACAPVNVCKRGPLCSSQGGPGTHERHRFSRRKVK
jgi:hypothetical protein